MTIEYTDIEIALREILIELEVITPETILKAEMDIRLGLGMDEFQVIELTGSMEAEYDIQIDTDEAAQALTVGQFIELVKRNIEK